MAWDDDIAASNGGKAWDADIRESVGDPEPEKPLLERIKNDVSAFFASTQGDPDQAIQNLPGADPFVAHDQPGQPYINPDVNYDPTPVQTVNKFSNNVVKGVQDWGGQVEKDINAIQPVQMENRTNEEIANDAQAQNQQLGNLYSDAVANPAGKIAITPYVPGPVRAAAGLLYTPKLVSDIGQSYQQNSAANEAQGGTGNSVDVAGQTAYDLLVNPVVSPVNELVNNPKEFGQSIVDDPANLWNKVFLPGAIAHGGYEAGKNGYDAVTGRYNDAINTLDEIDQSIPKAPDSVDDPQAILQEARGGGISQDQPANQGQTPQATGGGDVDSFMTALSGQESGSAEGNYEAENGRTGAAGRFQIMPENWSNWAENAGLSPDAPMTPENQDFVAKAKLQEYYNEYGNWRDVAKAWYGGPDSVNWSDEAANRPQGKGDEPSLNEYADSVIAKMGGDNPQTPRDTAPIYQPQDDTVIQSQPTGNDEPLTDLQDKPLNQSSDYGVADDQQLQADIDKSLNGDPIDKDVIGSDTAKPIDNSNTDSLPPDAQTQKLQSSIDDYINDSMPKSDNVPADQGNSYTKPAQVDPIPMQKTEYSRVPTAEEFNNEINNSVEQMKPQASDSKVLDVANQSPFLRDDIIPAAKAVGDVMKSTKDDVQKTFAPSTVSENSKLTGQVFRENLADMAQKADRADNLLQPARDHFSKQTPEYNLQFMNAVENGTKHTDPKIQQFADNMRQILDSRVKEIQDLGTGKLQKYIENYFPHMWKDPKQAANFAASWLGKTPFEGRKSFLKSRTIPTIEEGIKAGLEPISDNPADLVLMKMREMDKYILANKTMKEEKSAGRNVFVRDVTGGKAPEGWTKIDDKIGTVYGPPTVDVKEAYDPAIVKTLNSTLDKMDVYHSRLTKIPLGKEAAGVWGLADPDSSEVITKFGGPESVLAHELGHQLAYKYGLDDILKNDKEPIKISNGRTTTAGAEMQRELQILSDKRMDPNSMSDSERKYVQGGTEPIAAVVEVYVHAPKLLQQYAPLVYSKFTKFLDAHPELHELRDIEPSLLLDENTGKQDVGGLVTLGHYYMPAESARLINNYLSPGLRDKSKLFKLYLGVANAMNQFQLGLSAFHLGFTSMDSIVSKIALAAVKTSHGDIFSALNDIAHAPLAPVANAMRGDKLIKEWMSPGSTDKMTAQIADAMKAGGGRVKMDDMYRTNIYQSMKDAFHHSNYPGAAGRLPFAFMEQSAKPILEYVVPRQKAGIFSDLMRYEMKRNPDMTRDQLRETAGKIWNSVDNRLGQLVYDNLFWNKTTKDILMASTRSVGWNLGTWRELGGAVTDTAKQLNGLRKGNKPELTYRMSYALALPITVGLFGAIAQYLYTGQGPQDMKDLFYPRTGTLDKSGRPQRIELPSYMKDLYAYYNRPGTTLTNKLHPMLSVIADMMKNKDYYGTEIYNKDDSLGQMALSILSFTGKQFIPFGLQGSKYNADLGGDALSKALPFVGVTPAPSDVNKTEVEKKISELMQAQMSAGSQPQEKADKRDLKNSIRRDMQMNGGAPTASLHEALSNHQITPKEAQELVASSRMSPLKREAQQLSPNDIHSLMDIAEPNERQTLESIYKKKIYNQSRR